MAACLNQSVKQNFIKSHTGDLFMVPSEALDRLQYEQKKNQLVRFSPKPWQHITPPTAPLKHLHRLPVKFRITYKVL